jgi:phosphoserine phosphatase RsbU/P
MKEEFLNIPASILIVDDNLENIQVLGSLIKSEGYNVEFALDGYGALDWIKKKRFDIILLDINMPGMDGYEVCSHIKNDPANKEIPVIFLTANTGSESLVKGFETGGVDYITKPFIKNELLARVQSHISIKKANDQIRYYLKEIEIKNRRILESIDYARYIQNAVLESSESDSGFLPEHFILYLPKDKISGDFYRFYQINNIIVAAILDCTGHGVPGALMSILGITLLNEIVLQESITEPCRILNRLKEKLIRSLGQKQGFSGIKDGIEGAVINFNPVSRILQYSGSFNPLIVARNNEIIEIKGDRVSIGYDESDKIFSQKELQIKDNDSVYLYTDGYIDQLGGEENKRFMIKRFKELVLQIINKSMSEQKQLFFENFNAWKGDSDQTDDILIFGIHF